MNKILCIILLFLIFGAALGMLKYVRQSKGTATYTIGILQTASHPALDASRQGFIEELKNKMGTMVEFVVQNAQGSVAQAHALAQQFHADKRYKGFFAIATPAAQAISSLEKERPIIISAVTDPHALGLVHPTTNVCGIQDMIDVKATIEMLMKLVPHVRKVGLLYTSGEVNSIVLAKCMHKELEARGLTPVTFTMSNEADVQAITELACRKVDVILTPTDNTVASTITVIAAITRKHKKPFITSDNTLVAHGALAARGVDYKTSGKRAAQIAYQVFVEGKKPSNLPVQQAQSKQVFINRATLNLLGLTIPDTLHNQIVWIDEER